LRNFILESRLPRPVVPVASSALIAATVRGHVAQPRPACLVPKGITPALACTQVRGGSASAAWIVLTREPVMREPSSFWVNARLVWQVMSLAPGGRWKAGRVPGIRITAKEASGNEIPLVRQQAHLERNSRRNDVRQVRCRDRAGGPWGSWFPRTIAVAVFRPTSRIEGPVFRRTTARVRRRPS